MLRFALAPLVLIAALLVGGNRAIACDTMAARYVVRQIDDTSFGVEATFNHPVSTLDVYFFPVPGRPEGQAASIQNLQGVSSEGRSVVIDYVGGGTWRSRSETPLQRITYFVRSDHDEVDWSTNAPGKDEVATRLDDSYYFVGSAFFLIDYNLPACPIQIVFDLPSSHRVTSPWIMRGNVATAANPRNLTHNAFVIGPSETTVGNSSNLQTEWIIDGRLRSRGTQIAQLMRDIPPAYIDFWGSAPTDRLVAFFLSDHTTDGGAFQNTIAMRIATPPSQSDEIIWRHMLGHEIMHLWLGGAIRPSRGSDISWFTEGFTDYLTIKLMHRTGLIDDRLLAQRIANVLRRFEVARRVSPQTSLLTAGDDRQSNWELIYGGGALTALLMDAELSSQQTDAFALALRDIYANSELPYDQERLMQRLSITTGGIAERTLRWVDSRPNAPAIRARLGQYGIDAAYFSVDEVYVTFTPCGNTSCAPPYFSRAHTQRRPRR